MPVDRKVRPGARDRSDEKARAVPPPTSCAWAPCCAFSEHSCARLIGATQADPVVSVSSSVRGAGACTGGGNRPSGATEAAATMPAASTAAAAIGRWPVHRQMLPATACSSSIGVAPTSPAEPCRREKSAITNPGVQNPHCVACPDAIHDCTAAPATPRLTPSTVVTTNPSAAASGSRHDATGRGWLPSGSETTTVQEPHAPTSQPSFTPTQRSESRSQRASVVSAAGSTPWAPLRTVRHAPFRQIWIASPAAVLAAIVALVVMSSDLGTSARHIIIIIILLLPCTRAI